MKISRYIAISSFLLISISVQSQFFAEFKSGYNFSLSKFNDGVVIVNPLQTDSYYESLMKHPLSNFDENKDISSVKPTLGSGISNEITLGYSTDVFAIKLSAGANIKELNFENKSNTIAETELNTYTDPNSTEIPGLWRYWFDEYLTTEYSYSMDFNYSIYYVNPELSVFYNFNKFNIGFSTGISYNLVRFEVLAHSLVAGNNDTWSSSTTYTSAFNLSPEKQTLDELSNNNNIRPSREVVVSYTLGLDFQYKINDNFSAICNIKYRPLIYSPLILTYTDKQRISNYNGDLYTEDFNNQTWSLDYNTLHGDGNWREIRDYNFSTIGVSFGVRYTFNKND